MSSRRFESPSRSKFFIFQVEHKGPKNEIFISGAPNSLQPNFVIHVLKCTIIFADSKSGCIIKRQTTDNFGGSARIHSAHAVKKHFISFFELTTQNEAQRMLKNM